MEHLAERLRLTDLDVIYSSDLKRSLLGAQIIARHHDVPLHRRSEMREMYFGSWEGVALGELRERHPEDLEERWKNIVSFKPPGKGESIGELSARVTACLQEILEENKGKNILLVGHGGVNRVILCQALGLDLSRLFNLHQDYGCLNLIDYFPDGALVRLMNT